MTDNHLTLKEFAEANERDVVIDELDGKITIQVLTAEDIFEAQKTHDIDENADIDDVDTESNIGFMNEIVYQGLLEPSLGSPEDAEKLGRFRQEIMDEILEFSGLADVGEEEPESNFQEDGEVVADASDGDSE